MIFLLWSDVFLRLTNSLNDPIILTLRKYLLLIARFETTNKSPHRPVHRFSDRISLASANFAHSVKRSWLSAMINEPCLSYRRRFRGASGARGRIWHVTRASHARVLGRAPWYRARPRHERRSIVPLFRMCRERRPAIPQIAAGRGCCR